jgi:SAM-dependent methyltransferase
MLDLNRLNPTHRFTGLADIYAQHRPSYPAAALTGVVQHCRLGLESLLVDVGCGTGISSRQFAALGIQVIGVEPNADMRRQAESAAWPSDAPRPKYRDGRAEATGLADGVADAVLAAQAFHWFDAPAALREFHRILKPDGWVILMWNERDETDPFTAAYGKMVRSTREAAELELSWRRSGEPLLTHADFTKGERLAFPNEQTMDEEGMLGRALSISYAPKEPQQIEAFTAALREVFARFQREGQVVLHYQTSIILAQRFASV